MSPEIMQRSFFSKSKKNDDGKAAEAEAAKEEPKEEEQKDEKAAAEDEKEQSASAEGDKKPGAEEDAEDSATSEEELTSEDIKKIRELIKEQDQTIEEMQAKVDKYEKHIKELRQKYTYQVAENDNTVKRYRKQIEDSKQFAISKFAKELLDVRDNLSLALQHVDMDKIKETDDIELLKTQFENIVKGQEMTSNVMDATLGRFDVVQFDPMDEKFDPNIHDAQFMIQQGVTDENENTVGHVMQTGWKIGDRVLRAAKVGIFKKPQ